MKFNKTGSEITVFFFRKRKQVSIKNEKKNVFNFKFNDNTRMKQKKSP